MKSIRLLFVIAWAALCGSVASHAAHTFAVADGSLMLDGRPFTVRAAELHYPRIPRPYWEHRIKMCKSLGMNTICLYVFWNLHEPREGQFDFTGQNDVAHFCRLAQKVSGGRTDLRRWTSCIACRNRGLRRTAQKRASRKLGRALRGQ